jgi:predicted SAM-dependent methyltransferase
MIRYSFTAPSRITGNIRSIPRYLAPWLRRTKRSIRTLLLQRMTVRNINLCSGTQNIPGYHSVDFSSGADICLDLSKNDLPFRDRSIDAVVCMSAINYFSRSRGQELVNEIYRILRPGGITRFGVQDMERIARRYVEKDTAFFMQKLSDGKDRFEGPTLGDKFAAWFYGYAIAGFPCRYFYDYESLAHLFKTAGFRTIEPKSFRESTLDQIEMIDNRPDQMFFLEAVK